MINRPYLYYGSLGIAKVSWYNLFDKLFHVNLVSSTPPETRDAFWITQLEKQTRVYYNRYKYPAELYRDLTKISSYCRENSIKLTFLIPPTHIELQNKIDAYGLRAQSDRFKRDLAGLAPTIDFDYPNAWTRDRGLFNDPYHAKPEVVAAMVAEVWGNRLKVGRLLSPGTDKENLVPAARV